MLQIILLLLLGVLSKESRVNYPGPICAARGSNVTINCTITYKSSEVKQVKWCSMNSNSDAYCVNGPYVYDSEDKNQQNKFRYIGDNSSNCSLLISNVKLTDYGEYRFRFRFTVNSRDDHWTEVPGVKISVHDLRVFMNSSRENGSTIVGDSVNLTCSLDCSAGLSDVQWFKNGHLIQQSNPVLIFTTVTAGDSGNYSCSLRNFKNTSSEELGLYIEGVPSGSVTGSLTILIIVASLVTIVFIIAFVMLIRRVKTKNKIQPMQGEENPASHDVYQTTAETQASSVTDQQETENKPPEEEVQYSSVNFKAKETPLVPVAVEQEEDSTIYSAVRKH